MRGAATALTVAGTAVGAALAGRNRSAPPAPGSPCWPGDCSGVSVMQAGRQSAEDPAQTVEPQRARLSEHA